jgi:hypothetical protein
MDDGVSTAYRCSGRSAPTGQPQVTGVLVKYNQKAVTVVTDEGQRWNVAPALLRPAEPKDITPQTGNVV